MPRVARAISGSEQTDTVRRKIASNIENPLERNGLRVPFFSGYLSVSDKLHDFFRVVCSLAGRFVDVYLLSQDKCCGLKINRSSRQNLGLLIDSCEDPRMISKNDQRTSNSGNRSGGFSEEIFAARKGSYRANHVRPASRCGLGYSSRVWTRWPEPSCNRSS